jgi:hypothetical protein
MTRIAAVFVFNGGLVCASAFMKGHLGKVLTLGVHERLV